MKRGEIWTAAGNRYVGEPRAAVIVQDDRFDATDSVTVCALTTDPTEAPLVRVPIRPDHGLHDPSSLMIDKITTVPRSKLRERITCSSPMIVRRVTRLQADSCSRVVLGQLGDDDMVRLNRAILVFLGLALG